MFSDNDRISWLQMERQISLAYLGPVLLLLPGSIWGRNGIFSVILGTGILFVWIFFLLRQVNVYKYPERYWGKWPARGAALIFQAYLAATGGWLLAVIIRLLSEYLIPGIPGGVLGALAAAVALVGSGDIQSRGRFAQAAWPLTAVLLGVLMLLAAFQGDTGLMMEETRRGSLWSRENLKQIGEGTLSYMGMLLGITLLPFSLSQTESKAGHRQSVFRTVGRLGLWAGAVLLLLLAVLGPAGREYHRFPMLDLMAGAKIPGGFLRRLDLIFLTAAMFALLFSLGSVFFYSKYIWNRVGVPAGRLPAAAVSFLLANISFGGWEISEEYGALVLYIFLPLLAAMGICSGFLRRRKIG